jgi:hypothetical protein
MDVHTCAAARVPELSFDLTYDGRIYLDSVTGVEVEEGGLYLIGYRHGLSVQTWFHAGERVTYMGPPPRRYPRV